MPDLRLLFAPATPAEATAANSYRAQLADARGRRLGVEVPFTPFLTEDDYEDLRWYLEDYMDLPDGGAVLRAQRIERNLGDWGGRLYAALFTAPDNREFLRELLEGPAPRRLTVATRDPALLRLPWELMADAAGSLAQRLSVRRQLETTETSEEATAARPARLPLRILYIVSRPADAGFIDPRLTTKALFDALDPLGAHVRVDFCRPPTLARMEEMLRDGQRAGDPYGLVHFDGHGTFLPQAQIGALCFEKPGDGFGGSGASATDLVPADRLGDLLVSYAIPFVVLEACRSATVGKTAVFRSVAPRLIQAGVGSVLSMGHAVHVEAARLLLDRFYRELVRGTTIGQAVAEARKALLSTPGRWIESGPGGRTIELTDWFLPHLYQRAADDVLVPPDAIGKEPVRQFNVFLSHQHNDAARVEALARRLTEKHGLRVWLDAWECVPGKLEPQCETGIRNSRFTVVVGSQTALRSKWVQWEIDKHAALNPEEDRLVPVKFEKLDLPPALDALLWVDFIDPARDADATAHLARLLRSADAEDARRRRGFRSPAGRGEPSPFPPSPQYGFQGRARELYELERLFRSQRGIVLHAMGGMGKTALATEAAQWWTRSGLFRDGACFLSFERSMTADRAVQVLGTYLAGPKFEQLPAIEQRRRAIELFGQKDVLLVWDNYESVLPQWNVGVEGAAVHGSPYTDDERHRLAELFRDLTAGSGKGCLLVTCRPGDTGLPGAQRYELEGLARADSLWLLASILRRYGLTLADPRLRREQLDPLLRDLADHPLSLELVGPHLRTLTPEEIRADFGKLLAKFQQEAAEERNQSLLVSLEFSRRHLSPAAREALPWLGLFSGGVFEDLLLDVSQIAPEAWEPIRRELEGIALLRTEADLQIGKRPFLRFHPTLAAAVADPTLAQNPEIRQRFFGVYLALRQALHKALTGSQSRAALEVLNREEANYRTAVQWAVADQQLPAVAALGDTFSLYLQRSGRLRERDAWVQWLKHAVGQQGFTKEAANYEREHAWTRFTQGDPQGAVDQLQTLIERLRQTTEFDPAFQLALAVGDLGKVLDNAGASAQAIPILQEAVGHWEALVEKAGGRPWEELLASPDQAKVATEFGNLSATMGDLANALRRVGQHDEALAVAEKALVILQKMGHHRAAAAGHGICAKILMDAGRYDEADARYHLSLATARQAGDKGLEGGILQNQGILTSERHQLERASRLYQQALERFQEAGDQGAMMQTYNLLGVVEQKAGRLAEARAWYEKSRELAVQLRDQPSLGYVAGNSGTVWQLEGEAARGRGDEPAARRCFEEARNSVEESLRIWQAQENKPYEATSRGHLAQIHLRLGDLAAAERHAHEAREIREALGLKEAWKDYDTLSEIAQARGDLAAAAEWAKKRDDLLAELERRAGGGGGLAPQMLQALQRLTLACAQAGFGEDGLGPGEEEVLAQLAGGPAPFPDLAGFLRRIAAGEVPPVPEGLPRELGEWVEAVVAEIGRG
ncbi:MAG TPA: tetratricopeptide repeat protein [Thermoanaerobaculia bacterium]|jgi:tetratricopeptide (TPR) repeat protein|nr:tetratricopeptide repeat protein [Thermoanaerobaculia bacterium]